MPPTTFDLKIPIRIVNSIELPYYLPEIDLTFLLGLEKSDIFNLASSESFGCCYYNKEGNYYYLTVTQYNDDYPPSEFFIVYNYSESFTYEIIQGPDFWNAPSYWDHLLYSPPYVPPLTSYRPCGPVFWLGPGTVHVPAIGSAECSDSIISEVSELLENGYIAFVEDNDGEELVYALGCFQSRTAISFFTQPPDELFFCTRGFNAIYSLLARSDDGKTYYYYAYFRPGVLLLNFYTSGTIIKLLVPSNNSISSIYILFTIRGFGLTKFVKVDTEKYEVSATYLYYFPF